MKDGSTQSRCILSVGVLPPCDGSESGEVPCVSCTAVSALSVAAASTFLLFGDGDEEENTCVGCCAWWTQAKEKKRKQKMVMHARRCFWVVCVLFYAGLHAHSREMAFSFTLTICQHIRERCWEGGGGGRGRRVRDGEVGTFTFV